MNFTKCLRPKKEQKENTMKNKEDYKAVGKYVQEEIIKQNWAVSMTVLHELYGLEIGDCHNRHTLIGKFSWTVAFLCT